MMPHRVPTIFFPLLLNVLLMTSLDNIDQPGLKAAFLFYNFPEKPFI